MENIFELFKNVFQRIFLSNLYFSDFLSITIKEDSFMFCKEFLNRKPTRGAVSISRALKQEILILHQSGTCVQSKASLSHKQQRFRRFTCRFFKVLCFSNDVPDILSENLWNDTLNTYNNNNYYYFLFKSVLYGI